MKECSKSIPRRLNDSNFLRKYFVGNGIDIGGKPDPLELYKELFPLMDEVKTWDWEDGDAQFLATVENETYDFVFSSHCLEHLVDPLIGLQNWMRVVKPNGHLVITVPDEDLYEQGVFPSTLNRDHKWTFTIFKGKSWSEKSLNVLELLSQLGPEVEVLKVEQLSANYRFTLPRYDQTLTPIAECCIEIIVRKRTERELEHGGRTHYMEAKQPEPHMRKHYNQYANDVRAMKNSNLSNAPFEDTSEL